MKIQGVTFNDENESSLFISESQARQSHDVASVRTSWSTLVAAAISVAETVDPFQPDLPVGARVHAVDARNWGSRNVDIRPRLVDKSTSKVRLIDTGSQISVTVRQPGDKLDNTLKLVAVN